MLLNEIFLNWVEFNISFWEFFNYMFVLCDRLDILIKFVNVEGFVCCNICFVNGVLNLGIV